MNATGLLVAGVVSALCSLAVIVTSLVGLVTLIVRLIKHQRVIPSIWLLVAFPVTMLLGILVFGNKGDNGVVIASSLIALTVSMVGYFVSRKGDTDQGTEKVTTQ